MENQTNYRKVIYCLCLPCGELTKLAKEIRTPDVSDNIKQKLNIILPSSETISSCISKYYKSWMLFEQEHCNCNDSDSNIKSKFGGKKIRKQKKQKIKINKINENI